ncbi:DUF6065 family protein [Humisphaera borealis]|uniref:Uncharacterized protein n=1 Tax=Humisphaera borealis TaxID=2807512 RepID=A0A7M2WU79_9BACT|nr:DUF6065 family protein [Humisphaera borealis]QOV89036.1 hypothetical protein IPV69_22875 [Humisphaera borealis]
MLHYFKFRQDLFDPEPAKDIYIKHTGGKGWPEECPPLRGANAYGFDLLANFDLTLVRKRDGDWKVEDDLVIESDFDWSPPSVDSGAEDADGDAPIGRPLTQQYAWFWQKGQKLPHVISDDVYAAINHQVKVSTFLFLKTDPNEILLMTDIPNLQRPWRAMSALIETDWFPASYPWHTVLELDRSQKRIEIKKGDPICRIIPLRRDTHFAQQMSPAAFDEFFERGQQWLTAHGKPGDGGTMDITRTYVRQQIRPRFVVL